MLRCERFAQKRIFRTFRNSHYFFEVVSSTYTFVLNPTIQIFYIEIKLG